MASLDERLQTAIERRDKLSATIQRVEGRMEVEKKNLEQIEAECREKGLDPETLDQTIKTLKERYESEVAALEQAVAEAETALQPFLQE